MSFMKFGEILSVCFWRPRDFGRQRARLASAGAPVLLEALGIIVGALSHDEEVDQDAGEVKRCDDHKECRPGCRVADLFEDACRIEEPDLRGKK